MSKNNFKTRLGIASIVEMKMKGTEKQKTKVGRSQRKWVVDGRVSFPFARLNPKGPTRSILP